MAIIGAFPVIKLAVLALFQVSKPISNFMKTSAKGNAIFRNYICIPSAQTYNYFEVKLKMLAMNLGVSRPVRPLNEAAAIDLAANLLGEGIVFAICAAGLTYEYRRQSRKEKKKQAAILLEDKNAKAKISEMNKLLDFQEKQIVVMTKLVKNLRSKRSFTD